MCSSRTDGSLARARHQRVTSDPCFHFFAFYPHQGNPPTTTVRHLFRCFDEPLIECSDIGGFGPRCQVAMMMEPDSSLAPADATLSSYSLALMWSARANSYWPAPCNLRCADLKKLFHRTNRWLAGLAGLACTSVADAKGAINLVSGWCNTSSCIMHLIQLHSYCQCIIWLYSMY